MSESHESHETSRKRGVAAPRSARSAQASTQAKVVIPDEHSMVALLGRRDEVLRVIEKAFRADIHVRGNEITITGTPEESAAVVRLFEELVELLRGGAELTPDAVERGVPMPALTAAPWC